jgi:RimJ/RimL family protein N-acetyltransferase
MAADSVKLDGVKSHIRRLWPSDVGAYRAHLLRLDSDARYSRFFAFVSDEVVAEHANRCFGGDTLVFGFFVDGEIRGAAELHILRSPAGLREREAETAFSIEKPWRHIGLGAALLQRLMSAASSRGMRVLIISCLPQNFAMQSLAKKFGVAMNSESDEVMGRLKVQFPTAQSFLAEFIEESCDFATALIDLQRRIFPSVATLRLAA